MTDLLPRGPAVADPVPPALMAQLQHLALDLFWTWHHAADDLWERLDAGLWAQTRNAWAVLQTVSRQRLAVLAADAAFRRHIDRLVERRARELDAPSWYHGAHPGENLGVVAYFSMEFMLSEALPLYSGGLGNVAGDQLKAASDLGVPMVGVGLLFQQGYFRQTLDAEGRQHALYPYNDPTQLPISPVRGHDGEWLRITVEMPGRPLCLRAWQAQVGRNRLYLLDANDPANDPAQRGLTGELYGGGPELRLAHEVILGIGGWQLLEALGLDVKVCHLNEGHAAFTVLARARSFMAAAGCDFACALATTRAGNLFTTHTPVAAGFDRFAPEAVVHLLGGYARQRLGLDARALLALGRLDPADAREPFSMAWLALRGSAAVNGVSRLHGEVSRDIFQPLFPRWPRAEVPVGYVTNGVHMPSWDSRAADAVWTARCGQERWRGALAGVGGDLACADDETLWQMRAVSRQELVQFARGRLADQLAAAGSAPAPGAGEAEVLDPNVLTLGFARRFAPYKRPNLLLHDPARLTRLLTDARRPVQIVIAGKAHPRDLAGQAMIAEWTRFIRSRPELRARAVFLADYDMLVSEHLVQGVDVWLNTPRRPWEASGTSGMKVLVNGGLNLSELDGWWAEAYSPEVGWALGDGREHDADPAWDAHEAECLYRILEQEVVPAFYTRDDRGIPVAFVQRIRASMSQLTPHFSANRAVRDYTETYYLPAAVRYMARAAEGGAVGAALVAWQAALSQHWHNLHFGRLAVSESGPQRRFALPVYLDDLSPDHVQVQLYADSDDGPEVHPMQRQSALSGAFNGNLYTAELPADRPAGDYTARIVPWHPQACVPLEAQCIHWYAAPD